MDYPAISRFSDYFENGYQIKAKPNDLEEYHILRSNKRLKILLLIALLFMPNLVLIS